MSAELHHIEGLLANRIGLDPVSVGSQLILRAARQRMNELGLDDLGAYERRLRQSESELQALIEEVVVSESWFFRDHRPFQWFGEYVRAHWLSNPLRRPLRVLSLPCAGGEEPYSIAMALWDLGLPTRRFHIDAVDVSGHRLAVARRAVYSPNAFRGTDLAYRARFFREHPHGYELDPSIRAMVRFLQASVLDPKLLEGSPPYDILFCRNLLIYLSTRARACVLIAIDRLLTADGLLFIGHADRLEWTGAGPKFRAEGEPGCFAYRRTDGSDACLPQLHAKPPWLMPGLLPSTGAVTPSLPGGSVVTPRVMNSANEVISSSPANVPAPLLDQAAALANQGQFDEAVEVCERHLQLQGISPSAYYLMGMISQAAGDRGRAEDCLRKTVYLDPQHDEALLVLALLAERRGDYDAAAGFRRRAERIAKLARKGLN